MDQFIPDMYIKSIFTIDYKALKKRGIKCLIFDLDNTIAPINVKAPEKEVKDLFANITILDFKIILMSNASKTRVKPFKEILNVDSSYYSKKPFKKKYKKVMHLYDFKESEIACIGDQLLTDIFGANRIGFLSILVNPLSTEDYFGTKVNRVIEKHIIKHLEKRNLFKVGEYYE